MRFTHKLLLFLCIAFAGMYAATPLWLPYILARQLPPGWQLAQLEAAYPGVTGIDIQLLRLKGELQMAGLTISAADIRFTYRGMKTDIDSLSLDARIRIAKDRPGKIPTLDDLSLPVMRLSGKLPELSVSQLRLALHPGANDEAGDIASAQPLVMVFEAFKLVPISDNSFHLAAFVNFEELPGIAGWFELDVAPNLLRAQTRFPADEDSRPWLAIHFEQKDQAGKSVTRIQSVFDTDSANPDWLGLILVRSTGGLISHATGKLELQAVLAGQTLQSIEHLSLLTEKLQLTSIRGTWDSSVDLMANRDGEKVSITLPAPAQIQYQDQSGWIDELLTSAVPGLQRTHEPQAKVFLEIDHGSSFEVQTSANPSIRFNGDATFNLTSSEQSFKLAAADFQAELTDNRGLASTTARGLITLGWEENAPFAWSSPALDLKADRLSLSNTGKLRISDQTIDFEQTGDFNARFEKLQAKLPSGQNLESDRYEIQGRLDFDMSLSEPDSPINFYFEGPVTAAKPVINLPGDGKNPPLTLTADDLAITAELRSQDGELISTGSGTLMAGYMAPLATSADRIDVTWQELDLVNLAGNLSTKTQGFATEFEAETWTGIEFDVSYTLRSNADIGGSGTLRFENGPEWPIEFTGNTQAERWDLKLSAASFELAQLRSLLQVAHFELPGSVKLTDGFIDLQGDMVVDDSLSAKMIIKGNGMAVSMHESSARNASFLFNAVYDHVMSASGPVSIESVALAGGIDVASIRADLELENMETFAVQNLYAEVFNGQIKLQKLRFSENSIEDSTVELSRIDLGSLLEFADIDGLEGTGTLEISLPVGSDSSGVYIRNGAFYSTGPGRIAYTKEGVASSNIGLQALENFQYQVLSGTVDYQSDGVYRMAIRLEGTNPDLYEGHPIVFNLNINGTLPELFEALFITGNFEEAILKQIKIK